MTTRINVAQGKYTIAHEHGVNLRVLRYGEEWRDAIGDGFILSCAQEIENLVDALRGLDAAYCRAGPDLNATERAEDRQRLIEARRAIAAVMGGQV